MKLEKIIKKLEEHVVDVAEDNYDMGYFDGHIDGVNDGIATERERVIGLFETLSTMNMENGSATKAKQYYEAAQLIKIANDMEKQDWSEEAIAARYQEDLEKDGF